MFKKIHFLNYVAVIDDLCEIETLIEKTEDVNCAMQKLIAFVEAHGIILEPVLGNLIALIKTINPEHFEILEEARAKRILDKKSL